MKGIQNSSKGIRMLLIGILMPGKGQQTKRLLNIVERAYIENALTEGHDLLNIKGTKVPIHSIFSKGAKTHHKPFPRIMKHKVK